MPEPLENVCRTCMLSKKESKGMEQEIKMVEIFTVPEESPNKKLSLKEMLKIAIPQLKIEENNQLPKNVCQNCEEKIKDIFDFQQKCVYIENKLLEMLNENNLIHLLGSEESLEKQIIKTEVNDTFSSNNSMDCDNHEIMEENELNDTILNDGNVSDWDELHQPSKSKTHRKSQKRRKTDDKTKKSAEKIKQTTSKRVSRSKRSDIKDVYPCDKCQRKLISKASLIKHQEMHLKKDKEEQELKCSICNQEFSDRVMFKNHQTTHNADKPYLCSECGKGFASAGSLKQHSFRHLDTKLYPCSYCPKSFPTRNDLLCHYEIHKAKPRIHVCDVCGRGFYKPFLLKQHQRYHNDERPFACTFCEKRFVTSEKHQRHVRIHTGEKPYRCKYCERAFAQSNDCIKHLRQHLGENVYQCELCPSRFPLARDLRAHFSSHKDDDDETRARNLEARLEEERSLQNKLGL